MRRLNWLRFTRDAMVVLGILAAVAMWWYYSFGGLGKPVDAYAYWSADPNRLYPSIDNPLKSAYLYPPPFEYLVGWTRLLPFDVFIAIWRAILLAALVYLAGPFTLPVLLTVPVASEINAGNIQILLALAIVLGFRWAGTWAFVLLTKASCGVGLLWFVVRREWAALRIAIGVTAIIGVASLITHGSQWSGYLVLITGAPAPSVAPYYLPLWVRLPPAIALTVIGARLGWRWTVVAGSTLALPVFYIISWSMLVGMLPFVREAGGRWMTARGWSLDRRPGRAAPAPQPRPTAP